MFYPFRDNQSYGDHLKQYFSPAPSPSQGWFLCYLFVFSQIFAGLFVLVHPNHQVRPTQLYRVCSLKIKYSFPGGRTIPVFQEADIEGCSGVLLCQLFRLPHSNTRQVCQGCQLLAWTPG